MRIVKPKATDKSLRLNRRLYQIKIGDTWRTIAVLQRNFFDFLKGAHRYELYFLDYGEEYIHEYGDNHVRMYRKKHEWVFLEDAIDWATPIVQKKLCKIANGILDGLKVESEGNE